MRGFRNYEAAGGVVNIFWVSDGQGRVWEQNFLHNFLVSMYFKYIYLK
jgi:hypothetical protein